MDEDDDDLYGPSGSTEDHSNSAQQSHAQTNGTSYIKDEELEDGEEDGEEIEEDSDSDIDIITERTTTITQPVQRVEAVKSENNRAPSADRPLSRTQAKPKSEPTVRPIAPQKPGSQYPEVHTSTIDVNADPVYEPAGKPITELFFDADLAEHDKPWRRPGSDQSDYFNYGFDEFTWATYCLKQKSAREVVTASKAESANFEMLLGAPGMPAIGMGGPGPTPAVISTSQQQATSQQQKLVSQQQQHDPTMQMGGSMAGMAGMAGMPGMPGMSGVPDMPPEIMNQMVQQFMQQGIDPATLDLNTFMQQFQQMQGGGMDNGMMAGMPQQAQGFGGPNPGGFVAGGGGGGGGGGGTGGGGGGGGRRGRSRW